MFPCKRLVKFLHSPAIEEAHWLAEMDHRVLGQGVALGWRADGMGAGLSRESESGRKGPLGGLVQPGLWPPSVSGTWNLDFHFHYFSLNSLSSACHCSKTEPCLGFSKSLILIYNAECIYIFVVLWLVFWHQLINIVSFLNLFFNWRIIALQNFVVFSQTSTWISHRYTYIPSLLNLPPTSLPIPSL